LRLYEIQSTFFSNNSIEKLKYKFAFMLPSIFEIDYKRKEMFLLLQNDLAFWIDKIGLRVSSIQSSKPYIFDYVTNRSLRTYEVNKR